jgi:hypothetical protein
MMTITMGGNIVGTGVTTAGGTKVGIMTGIGAGTAITPAHGIGARVVALCSDRSGSALKR